MSEFLRNILFEYPNWIVFLPLLIAVGYYKGYVPEFRYITWYLVVAVITQVLSFTFWKLNKNNYPILHIYTLLEYFILLRFYSQILKDFIPKIIFTILLSAFLLFSMLDSVFIESIFSFNTYSRSIEALILITLSVCWFLRIVSETEEEKTRLKGVNYFIFGFFIYFSSSIILFSYSSYVAKLAINARMNVWTIHTLLVVQLYILITVGLWKAKTK